MKYYFLLILFIISVILHPVVGQETFPVNDVKDKRSECFAFVNADIIVDASTHYESATLLIRKGKIVEVGDNVNLPDDCKVIDLTGYTVYPSLIDLYAQYGVPAVKEGGRPSWRGREKIEPETKGPYNANDAIKSYFHAVEHFSYDEKEASQWRESGFGSVHSFRADGIAQGTGVVVSLGEERENKLILKDKAAAMYAFDRGSSEQYYPRSMMGYISLLRQTYLDAQWYASQSTPPFSDLALEAWLENQQLTQIFTAGNWLNILRADKVGDEFGIQYIIKTSGNEYQRVEEVKATGAKLIVPLNFPDAYDVEDPIDAEKVALEDMLHWELAPTNPGVLEKHNITFALTTHGLKKKSDLFSRIRQAVRFGLSETKALEALTTVPASMLGVDDMVGKLAEHMVANFIITDGPIFDENTKIYENWIQGKPYIIHAMPGADPRGTYGFQIGNQTYNLAVEGTREKPKSSLTWNDTTEIPVHASFDGEWLNMRFSPGPDTDSEYRLSGWKVDNGWKGRAQTNTGAWVDWSMTLQESYTDESKPDSEQMEKPDIGSVLYPFLAYGTEQLPTSQSLLIKNATVWTSEAEGVLSETDVLVRDGKIERIGKDLKDRDAVVIDGTDKHLTAGIIDEHTHIAGGGNEVATNSAMVRIGDQVNSEDINIYRSLAGGVTTAQVLHGSANPIGGQSALIKLKWGAAPEDLKIDGADAFIKFALGENVKRSSNEQSVRFPQTRMGVEQVFVDAFTNAVAYQAAWKAYQGLSAEEKMKTTAPRRDLAVEAMLDIVNSKMFITCHSYVQSEINMLMKVADQFDFTVNTFTHILEGYKVADKMREHGVAASTFSDWWNYKWEVRYAIPYNAAIMHREGVLTAINSDDANMGRRLNQEAAKAIKYGDLPEEEVLKMVTLNPAKMLHLDDRIGSIKTGKDADLVLWTDHPLSVYARADKTIIEGVIYFDMQEDEQRRVALQQERNRLIQKMIKAKHAGSPTRKAASKMHMEVHCESVLGETHFGKH